MLSGFHIHQRFGIAALASQASGLGHVVEEGKELVKFTLRQGIILVIVATRAAERETQPRGAGGFHPINHRFHAPFLGDDAAFAVDAVVAIETGGHLLLQRRLRQHVPGQLFNSELVKRLVRVQRLNQPIAPRPLLAAAVGLVAVAVGVARVVQPRHGHVLAIPRRS